MNLDLFFSEFQVTEAISFEKNKTYTPLKVINS